MSHIEELIAKLAPQGVEYNLLGDVATLVRGNGMPKSDLIDSGVGAIHYGQIYTRYKTSAATTYSFVSPEKARSLTKAEPGDVIITNTSENLEDVGKAVAWLGSQPIVTGGHATVIKHDLEPRYLSYWLQSSSFSAQKKALATGAKIIDVSAKQLAKIRIPIPPRPVQLEISRILDIFVKLEAELEAELEARRRQYNYYREQLFGRIDGESATLLSLGRWQGGVTPSKANMDYWHDGDIPWLASMDVSDESTDGIRGRVTRMALNETSLKLIPAPSVVVVVRSNILRRTLPVGLINVDVTINQDIRALIPRVGVEAEYVYHALRAFNRDIRSGCVRTDGSMAAVSSGDFFAWKIPLPALDEQRRIASQLRAIDSLVNDLSVGLPAELRARKKQYEYYRDKLLTFDEAPS